MDRTEKTADIELLLTSGDHLTIRVEPRNARDLRGSTAEFIRVWSVDHNTWCHIRRDQVVYALEPSPER